MINCRYVIAFGGSLFVYLSIGVLFFIISQSTYKEIIAKESQSKITLSLEQFQKPQPLMPQPQNNPCCIIKPKQEPLKTVPKNPTIFKKYKQIHKPKQETLVSISPKQIPLPSKQYIPQELPETAVPNKIDSGAFEAMVKNRIMQNKFYPLIAKNAGIEGIVNASFVILPNGNVGEISVSGSNALKGAARQAISRAFPIDVSNCPVSLPTTMHISLRYSLISD